MRRTVHRLFGVAAAVMVAVAVATAMPAEASAFPATAMIENVQTGKCLTIAGGVSADNNVPALQFDCDNHPSRRWKLR